MLKEQPNLRRRTFFTPLLMPILGTLLALGLLAWFYNNISTTTVVLVRHAEKIADGSEDPGLTPEGIQRARKLATMFSSAEVDALYASQYRRTSATLAPLAEGTGKDVEIVDAGDPGLLVETILSSHRGDLIVVAGHSNTIPELVGLLANIETPAIDETEYSGIYVVTLPRFGEAKLLVLRYPD